MGKIINKSIPLLFNILFFATPLILYPKTSEIFEFNKIVFIYIITILITSSWITKMIFAGKIIFRKSLLALPLILFLISNTISTLFSIDPRTSIFGYYSRFNGGLLSTICYLLLYWAYVSNMDKKKTKNVLTTLLTSSFFVGAYSILQHFGIDKKIWADDVVNRVFSTIGQPNWLAAWVVSILPLTWVSILELKPNFQKPILHIKLKYFISILLSISLFLSLIFTKSRSGFIAFGVSFTVFWAIVIAHAFIKNKDSSSPASYFKIFITTTSLYLLLAIFFGTPWTASVESKVKSTAQDPTKRSVTSILESGSEGSGQIRLIVWRGALSVWKQYPWLGSGVETFAYTYHKIKPAQHNITAEWDYLYNKAHNEYLNYLATTGLIGFSAYVFLIFTAIYQILKPTLKPKSPDSTGLSFTQFLNRINLKEINILQIAIFAGYLSLLITNLLGFSVVITAVMFYLLPATAFSLSQNEKQVVFKKIPNIYPVIIVMAIMFAGAYFIFLTGKYWYADYLYAATSRAYESGNLEKAQKTGSQLLKLSPDEPNYHDLQSRVYAETALYLHNQKSDMYKNYIELSATEANTAIKLSPANVLFRRNLASIYLNLAAIDSRFLLNARSSLEEATLLAPTDAKLLYNLGLIYMKLGENDLSEKTLAYTISIKDNYASARYALALLKHTQGEEDEARSQLEYILDRIDPGDDEAKRLLAEIK